MADQAAAAAEPAGAAPVDDGEAAGDVWTLDADALPCAVASPAAPASVSHRAAVMKVRRQQAGAMLLVVELPVRCRTAS